MDRSIPGLVHLQDKDIWVIGGAGYLGQAVVRALDQVGARVLCIDLASRAEQFVREAGLPPTITPATLDIRDGAAIDEFVACFVQLRGVPHGLVNLSFASTGQPLEALSETEFDAVNHGGITATFLLSRAVGTQMALLGRGSLVLFSSMYGIVSPDPALYKEPMVKNSIEYGVAKAGIIQMTRYLAVHWGMSNVRCNCISPGPFPNPAVQRDHPDFMERLAQKSPMGRIGQASEIAGAVVFLLSDVASYITGQNLSVDGGWTCW